MESRKTINVGDHCGALFAHYPDKVHFIGSAFFFRHRGRVLAATADHCIASQSDRFHIVCAKGIFYLDIAKRDADLDLCIFMPQTFPEGITAELVQDTNTPGNVTLYAYEFSTTEVVPDGYHLNPASRIGNCVRVLDAEPTFGRAGQRMLELSFPALKGASGSAIIELRGSQMFIHGVLVANVQRHLLPAQIETVLDEKNGILEERKYFLPQAAAVNAVHLASLADAFSPEQAA